MSTFQNFARETSVDLQLLLEKILREWSVETKNVNANLSKHADLFIDRNFGGKMLRGCLVKLGYEIASGKSTADILNAAAAIEIFQTSILAHDDIIDLSPTRRGKPTIYKSLGGDHYAISQTICLGDIGFFLAVKQISESNFNPKNKVKAVSYFSDMMIQTGLGQMLDIELPRIPKFMTEDAVLQIHRLKTSYYTFVYPFKIGAILGGAKPILLKNFESFGENLGLAFQIQDDILGVFGNEDILGKSAISDIVEGKNTLLYTFARKHADKKQLEILMNFYGKGEITKKQHELIKDVFVKSGSLEYSKKRVLYYSQVAKEIIPIITKIKSQQIMLTDLADYLVNREK